MGVSLRKISGKAEEIDYPWKEVEQARTQDEYLREGGRSNVSWIGDAGSRGFGGVPTQEDAHLLLNGMAADGERLLPSATVQGLDLTFSMVKDVSVLYAISGPAVKAAIDEVRAGTLNRIVEVLERDLLVVRRGSGRREDEREVQPASGLVGIRYEHSYNREGDPQLHDHVMVSTVVRNPDGAYQRMWISDMREFRRTLGYRHEAELREALSRRLPGIEWGPVAENGTAHIMQVPASLREAMSTRATEIKEQTDVWEIANGRRANSAVKQMITLQTRPPKPDIPDREKWLARQVAIAQEHGFTEALVQEQIVDAPPARWQEVPTVEQLADRLLGEGGLTATRPAFRASDVMVAVIQAGVRASQVDEYVARILNDERAIAVEKPKGVVYVTEELKQREANAIRVVAEGKDAVSDLGVPPTITERAIESVGLDLNDGQRDVIFAATTSPDRVVLIEAVAGTGKTTSALVMNRAFAAHGVGVRGAAPTGKAAVELAAGAGIDARTIDSLLLHVERGATLSENGRYRVLILDEAGMAHTRQLARLLEIAEREGMKVIAMGDSAQLTSVAPGGWLGYFSRTGVRPALRLTEIVRQRDPQHRKAISDLSRGRPGTWIKYQTDHGNVLHLGAGQEHQYGTRAAELLADAADRHGWSRVLAITPTNMRREAINEHVQQARLAHGELGDMLGESDEHERFHVGDRVMYVGRNDRQRDLQNGLIGTALGKTEQGELVISLNDTNTQLRTVPGDQVEKGLRLAYAVTDYKGQGVTVEEAVMVAAPEELSLNRGYVAASRAREQTKLVLIADTTTETALKDLARHLRIREDDELATEHINQAKEATMTQPTTTKQTTSRSPEPAQWLSKHRTRIEKLTAERDELAPILFPNTSDREQRLARIDSDHLRLSREAAADKGMRDRAGRQEREQHRNDVLEQLTQERGRLQRELSELSRHAGEAWDRLTPVYKERRALVEIAGPEEFAITIKGKHAPWVQATIGLKPPAGQPGLAQRWYQVGEYLGTLRVERGITDPTEIGLTDKDSMLADDISLLREHIDQARELGPRAPRVRNVESNRHYRPGQLELRSRLRENSHGFGVGD